MTDGHKRLDITMKKNHFSTPNVFKDMKTVSYHVYLTIKNKNMLMLQNLQVFQSQTERQDMNLTLISYLYMKDKNQSRLSSRC